MTLDECDTLSSTPQAPLFKCVPWFPRSACRGLRCVHPTKAKPPEAEEHEARSPGRWAV